jgi:SAM-dependent methyltransferase
VVGTAQIGNETEQGTVEDIRRFFDEFAAADERWRRRNLTYHTLTERATAFHVPPNRSVLELGCGNGELLAALTPSYGVGVDLSPKMVALAKRLHSSPNLVYEEGNAEELDLGEEFDYIVLSDLVPYVTDLQKLLQRVAAHSHRRTRVVVSSYNRSWRHVIRIAELLGLKPRKPLRNWVTAEDVENLLYLSGFEVLTTTERILLPKRIPFLTTLANSVLANVWPFRHLCLSYWIVARPLPRPLEESSVSVVCPCRNEAGHVAELVRRLPELGTDTELVFVEGGSSDDTRAAIERQIELHPERRIQLVDQPGRGKGDAVRAGFAAAENDVLMILDGDLSVAPEDLPKFYRALIEGRGELINGSRLVYDMEPGSMRALNVVGNKVFPRLFARITGQSVKDTLCGTKVLHREDYARIAQARSYFGEFDPFGDFDLLFGAARIGLRIVDLPVRYQTRSYGTTNISRFRHGLLLVRMTLLAWWKFRVEIFRSR